MQFGIVVKLDSVNSLFCKRYSLILPAKSFQNGGHKIVNFVLVELELKNKVYYRFSNEKSPTKERAERLLFECFFVRKTCLLSNSTLITKKNIDLLAVMLR